MKKQFVLALAMALALRPPVMADPCGMVPPLFLTDGPPITRVGLQKTYVFYKDGIETLVLRPGFDGKVDEFGMLIPFPSPPAIRKVSEDVFGHVAAAIDPPEVLVDMRENWYLGRARYSGFYPEAGETKLMLRLNPGEVVVLREEAVGMYQVAVLEAGSAAALQKWMDEHGFRYPEGMDGTCEEYVQDGWCFVAVKARIGRQTATEALPGMRNVDPTLPAGSGFDGHVQAMSFRFFTDELVVPMRLSAFNAGELHNVVYVLTDGPRKIEGIPEEYVVRQVAGKTLYQNLTQPLPLRILGGGLADIPEWRLKSLPNEREPGQYNGIAKELFAADLLAASTSELVLSYEKEAKELLEIGEQLGLRGDAIDALLHDALADKRQAAIDEALSGLHAMTMSVIDGDFPREVIAAQNLRFPHYAMASAENDRTHYDAKHAGPAPAMGGWIGGMPTPPSLLGSGASGGFLALTALALVAMGFVLNRGPRQKRFARERAGLIVLAALAGATIVPAPASAEPATAEEDLIELCCKPDVVGRLLLQAQGSQRLADRGWAIVSLTEHPEARVHEGLRQLHENDEHPLVRAWAGAARVLLADSSQALGELSSRHGGDAVLARPFRERWLEFLSSEDSLSVRDVLRCIQHSPELQRELIPLLLERDLDSFVELLTQSDDTNLRNLAAASLAAAAQGGNKSVGTAVLRALAFDPSAETVPWSGGALFLPQLGWQGGQAHQLASDLFAWLLWCDRHHDVDAVNQLRNNLASIQLARAAGYQLIGNGSSVDQWLSVWGQARGRAELERMFAQQGVEDEARFRTLLDSLY